jgi:hypothetical protein
VYLPKNKVFSGLIEMILILYDVKCLDNFLLVWYKLTFALNTIANQFINFNNFQSISGLVFIGSLYTSTFSLSDILIKNMKNYK